MRTLSKRVDTLEATYNTQSSDASTQGQRAVLANMTTPELRSLRSAIENGDTPTAEQIWQQAQREVSNNG